MSLSVAFFGSGAFAVPIVALLRARGVLRLLVTQDDLASWQDRVGDDVGLWRAWDDKLYRSLRGEKGDADKGGEGGVDAIITASYGVRLGAEILDCARLGSYNVHASLLPRWRGASPIQRAILHGDVDSGVSVIRMNERIDCGGVVLRKRLLLRADETYDSLEGRLSELAALSTDELLEGLMRGAVVEQVQDEEQASWACKLRREDGLLDWRAPAERLERQVRAFSRWPGSFFLVRGERVVLHASRVEGGAAGGVAGSGEIVAGKVLRTAPYPVVSCGEGDGEGALGLLRLQRSGRKVLDAADFLRGFRLEVGERLDVGGNLSEFSCAKGSV